MDNNIEEMPHIKKFKEKIILENNIFCNYNSFPLTNSISLSNVCTTKGRINKRLHLSNLKDIKKNDGIKRIINSEESSRLNAMKKCFDIVKNRNELNKILMNGCKKFLNEHKNEKQTYLKGNGSNERDIYSNEYKSFYEKNVDNFINNYLRNNYYVNENVNTLNNLDKYDDLKAKNITVNKNFSLFNLTKNKNIKESSRECKITVDKNKSFKNNKIKSNNKKNTRKIFSKKYINVNKIEQFKVKPNSYFLNIKNMFNNNKNDKLDKNNSFHEIYKPNKSIINVKRKISSTNKNSMTINVNDFDYKSNDSSIHHNGFSKNINLKERNLKNNNENSNLININKNNNLNINDNYCTKFNFSHNKPINIINRINVNDSKRIKSEKHKKFENKKNLNMIISPSIYNAKNCFNFNSPNLDPFRKISKNSPFNDNLSFSYNSLKEKLYNLDKKDNKFKTLNVEKKNNEHKFGINQIYTNINSSINSISKKSKINNINEINSNEAKKSLQINSNEDKYNTLNINKNQLMNNSFNNFSQMTNRDDTIPYIINHIETFGNNTLLDKPKEEKCSQGNQYFEYSEFSFDEKYLNTSDSKLNKSGYKNKSNNNEVFNENKNKSKIFENKNHIKDLLNNKGNKGKHMAKNNKDIIRNSKKKKLKIHSKQVNHDINKNIYDLKNKTSSNFFNNINKNYESLKKVPKLLREKHFSDINNTFFDKTNIINKKINSNKHLKNKLNHKPKSIKENEIKFTTRMANFKYSSNIINNNNIYKKHSSIKNERDNNFDTYSIRTNNKSFISDKEKILQLNGNKKNISINNKDNNHIKNKHLEKYNNNINNQKNYKKSERLKIRKNGTKDHGNSLNKNILKIKSKPNIPNCYYKKYYHYALRKNILNKCFINKKVNLIENNNYNYVYKRQLSLSNKRNNKNSINYNIYNLEKINGGINPSIISYINNNKGEINNNFSQDDQTIKYNTFYLEDSKNQNQVLNYKVNSLLKINKVNIKKQLDKKIPTIIKYKDFNTKLNMKDIKDSDSNSFLNYLEEDEVTFGRKDQIIINKFTSNKKKLTLNDNELTIDEEINNMNNNTFYYNNLNKNNKILDDEYVNGEAKYLNNSYSHSNPKCRSHKKIVYDFGINSITNNYYNNNNIILFAPQQKKLYNKYIEKGIMIIVNIILNHRINIYKNLVNFYIIQKNKRKSESVIYTKKKLKDNGGKRIETGLTPNKNKQMIFSEENYNNDDIILNSFNKKTNLFENKKNNIIKKLKKIRTKSSDYVILERKDKSLIKQFDVEKNYPIDNNNKKYKNENLFYQTYNTPRGLNVGEKNIVSPHFINNKDAFSKKIEDIKNGYNNNEIMLEKNNLKLYHCTPKFCQIKPKFVEDIKMKELFKEIKNKKFFTIEEIIFIGSSNSLCFKENYLTNEFITHCDELSKNFEILDSNMENEYKMNNIDKQNYNKSEILSFLNIITELNFNEILDKLTCLMINDNNNQYIFIKLIINKAMKEKKYIMLYAKLCCKLYNNILNRINNNSYNDIDFIHSNLNLGFDNDLKNILINESKLKFNSFIKDLNKNEIQDNSNDIKYQLFNFTDFIIELICSKIIQFDNIIYYLDKLYKEYINNNNGNNISILYLEEILYLLEILIRKIKYIENKNYEKFKNFIEEKIMPIIYKSELSQNYLKYKIINIQDKIKIFLDLNNNNNNNISINEKKLINIDSNENELGINSRYIDEIVNNILINNKKIQNIKLLLIYDLKNFLKMKNSKKDNDINKKSYNWYIIDELLFEIHINLVDFISFYIEISKDINVDNKKYQYEYFENVLNYFIQFSLDDIIINKEKNNKKIFELILNICRENLDKEEDSKDLYFENLGYILYLLLEKNIAMINDINLFINESISTKQNISNIIKYTILYDKGKYGKYFELFKQTNFFINNKELFYNIIDHITSFVG